VELSGEITAIATSVLALFAIVTAILAYLAFRKQSREVGAIERQVTDQQEVTKQQAELLQVQSGQLELQRQQFADQRAERRRAQASGVFIWYETGPDPRLTDAQIEKGVPWGEGVTAHIENTSGQPVYDVTIDWYRGTASWGEPDYRTVLLPGDKAASTRTFPEDFPAEADLTLFTPAARFRDAAAVYWFLRPDGHLDEIRPGEEPQRTQ
jgi:hypothetical protein